MTLPTLLLSPRVPAAEQERCREFVDFLHRRARFDSGLAPEPPMPLTPPDPGAAVASLLRLSDRGLLSYAPAGAAPHGEVESFYTASREASESVFNTGPEAGFLEPVQKKEMARFRTSAGARGCPALRLRRGR